MEWMLRTVTLRKGRQIRWTLSFSTHPLQEISRLQYKKGNWNRVWWSYWNKESETGFYGVWVTKIYRDRYQKWGKQTNKYLKNPLEIVLVIKLSTHERKLAIRMQLAEKFRVRHIWEHFVIPPVKVDGYHNTHILGRDLRRAFALVVWTN
jgi:hypothetical protein